MISKQSDKTSRTPRTPRKEQSVVLALLLLFSWRSWRLGGFVRSEQQLQSELNASRAVGRNESAEGRRADEVVRQTEVRMVEEIEELRAELDGRGFLYSGVLDQREVDVFVTRPVQDVAA